MIHPRFIQIAVLAAALTAAASSAADNPADFTVKSVTDGRAFTLSEAKGKYVALHFLLKTECPVCIRHTREYAQKSAGDTNTVHLFLKPDSEDEIKQWAGQLGKEAGFTIYRDPEAQLAKAYDIPHGYRFHGQTVHFPALLLLDRSGREVFRYVGKSNTDRFSYEKFSAKIQELSQSSPR